MDRPLSILLVEDEPDECEDIIAYIDSMADVSLVGVTNSASRALELFKDFLPDAIILDLELHKGGGTGLDFLRDMKDLRSSSSPYVLVTTNNISTITHENARKLGADFIMVKSQEDYSAQRVIDFLRTLRNTIHGSRRVKERQADDESQASPGNIKKRRRSRIEAELNLIGINPKLIGRPYLIDAILMIIDGFQGSVYPEIACQYSKNEASVERAMQNAINGAWRRSDIEDLQKYYTIRIHSKRGVPTVTELIHYYASKLKTEY